MVNVTLNNDKFIFKILGWHQIWALRSQFSIPSQAVVNAYQDPEELKKWAGWRVGTYIPFLITAGVFSQKGKRNFWDVMRRKNTIIVTLENQIFDKLYIEVANPQETINLLNSK
jgi:hypothetical protein